MRSFVHGFPKGKDRLPLVFCSLVNRRKPRSYCKRYRLIAIHMRAEIMLNNVQVDERLGIGRLVQPFIVATSDHLDGHLVVRCGESRLSSNVLHDLKWPLTLYVTTVGAMRELTSLGRCGRIGPLLISSTYSASEPAFFATCELS